MSTDTIILPNLSLVNPSDAEVAAYSQDVDPDYYDFLYAPESHPRVGTLLQRHTLIPVRHTAYTLRHIRIVAAAHELLVPGDE